MVLIIIISVSPLYQIYYHFKNYVKEQKPNTLSRYYYINLIIINIFYEI